MQMSEGEIVRAYKQAAKKQEQIRILSELNLCDKKTIREILRKNGIDVKEPQNRFTANKETTESGKETNGTVEQALKPILNEFDENEKMMREISAEVMKLRKEMIPLAAKYKEIELRQQELTEFIESICKIRERKPT